jgi:hypothetical protein
MVMANTCGLTKVKKTVTTHNAHGKVCDIFNTGIRNQNNKKRTT